MDWAMGNAWCAHVITTAYHTAAFVDHREEDDLNDVHRSERRRLAPKHTRQQAGTGGASFQQ